MCQLLNLIRYCDDSFIPRPLYMLPINHTWETQSGITILGDAAHLMSPFGAEGANLAMLDATELGLAITSSKDLTKSIKEYEQYLFIRAVKAAQKSAKSLDLCISSGNSAEKLLLAFEDLKKNDPAKN
jgi:2-polyprenyl-6-methoxyphenol hydroxylase-like FAD-dependent oxidoreductase